MIESTEDSAEKAEDAMLVWKNGVLMVKAQPCDEELKYYIDHAVKLDREARMRECWGGTPLSMKDQRKELEMSELIVDQAGKVEIPRSVCEHLGLEPGQRLNLETDDEKGSIRLSPVIEENTSALTQDSEPRLIEENGFLVIDAGEGLDILKLIERDREERMRYLMGGSPV